MYQESKSENGQIFLQYRIAYYRNKFKIQIFLQYRIAYYRNKSKIQYVKIWGSSEDKMSFFSQDLS